MRLGIVTDIHNDAERLRVALDVFHQHNVDQVVTLGDSCDAFAPPDGADEVASLLQASAAVGVWGNHDFHLCRNISDFNRGRFAPETFDYMKSLQPSLEINGCRFSHMDAGVDANDVMQLWGSEGERDLRVKANNSFAANAAKWQFMGHYHCWRAATPQGLLNWEGDAPLTMDSEQRYVVVVAGVFQGRCAIFDTARAMLEPHCCDSDTPTPREQRP